LVLVSIVGQLRAPVGGSIVAWLLIRGDARPLARPNGETLRVWVRTSGQEQVAPIGSNGRPALAMSH